MSFFFRIKDKAQALREIEQNCKAVELMRHRVRLEGSQGETLWAFLGLCADYATAKDMQDEPGKRKALKRINKWCSSWERDARALSRYWFVISMAEGWCFDNGVTQAETRAAKDVGFELGYKEAVRRGYIANGRK